MQTDPEFHAFYSTENWTIRIPFGLVYRSVRAGGVVLIVAGPVSANKCLTNSARLRRRRRTSALIDVGRGADGCAEYAAPLCRASFAVSGRFLSCSGQSSLGGVVLATATAAAAAAAASSSSSGRRPNENRAPA